MRKILLFGTMLGVATTALAFGGMFNHGSKSTTYKGGVDAIGVHFGGEKKTSDSQPEEETCPAEKQCGDYCCQGDNVCNTESGEPQCCNEYKCCANNAQAYCPIDGCVGPGPQCCAGEIFCSRRDAEGNCTTSNCCVNGTIFCLQEDENEICRASACCPNGFTAVCTGYNDEGICNDWWCG